MNCFNSLLSETMIGTLVFAFAYGYLWKVYREHGFSLWTAAFSFTALRFAAIIFGTLTGDLYLTALISSSSALAGNYFFLAGALAFLGRKLPKWCTILTVAMLVYILLVQHVDGLEGQIALPLYLHMAGLSLWAGASFLKDVPISVPICKVTGWGFVFWAAHEASYPFWIRLEWAAPIGDIVGLVCLFSIAIGMLILFFQQTHKISDENALRFLSTFETADLGVAHVGQNEEWLFTNDKFCELLGFSCEELKERKLTETLTCTHLGCPLCSIEAVGSDAAHRSFEHHHTRRDGTSVWLDFTTTPVKGASIGIDNYSVIFLKDVTERHQAEELLRVSEERHRHLVQQSGAVAWELNLESCEFTYISPGIEKILGYPRESWTNLKVWEERLHEEDREAAVNFCMEATREGRDHDITYRAVHSDGGERWILEIITVVMGASGPECLMGFMIDITKHRDISAKAALQTKAVESVYAAIVVTDVAGNIQYVNPAFEQITGYLSEEAIGRNPSLLKSAESPGPDFYKDLWDTISSGQTWHGNFTNKKKDGTLLREEATISPVINEAGRIVNYVAVKRDITREKALEAQLIQSQRMESIGVLAGGIAHDFNNILMAIMGYTQLAMKKLKGEDVAMDYLYEASKACDRAKDLVHQILAFSRRTEQEMEPVLFNHVLREAVKLLRPTIPATISIIQDIRKESGVVYADRTQLHQVILNLCTNAYHAMRKQGGRLFISLRPVEVGPNLAASIRGLEMGPHALLIIRDTGTGISPADLVKVFDPFFTTKAVGEGTGMGLAMVHGIVQQMGGALCVESVLGEGSAFYIYLPRQGGGVHHEETCDEIFRGEGKVLFVDDDPVICNLGQKMLEHLGYTITVTSSSAEALEIFEKDPHYFALVITDQTMPHMTGVELSEKIFALRPEIPIILCTGFSDLIDEEEALALGIGAYLTKPLDLATISRAMTELLVGKKQA